MSKMPAGTLASGQHFAAPPPLVLFCALISFPRFQAVKGSAKSTAWNHFFKVKHCFTDGGNQAACGDCVRTHLKTLLSAARPLTDVNDIDVAVVLKDKLFNCSSTSNLNRHTTTMHPDQPSGQVTKQVVSSISAH